MAFLEKSDTPGRTPQTPKPDKVLGEHLSYERDYFASVEFDATH
jgi:hypothetical protein